MRKHPQLSGVFSYPHCLRSTADGMFSFLVSRSGGQLWSLHLEVQDSIQKIAFFSCFYYLRWWLQCPNVLVRSVDAFTWLIASSDACVNRFSVAESSPSSSSSLKDHSWDVICFCGDLCAGRIKWTFLSVWLRLYPLWSTLNGKRLDRLRIEGFGLNCLICCIRSSNEVDTWTWSGFCCSCRCPRFDFAGDSWSDSIWSMSLRYIFRLDLKSHSRLT